MPTGFTDSGCEGITTQPFRYLITLSLVVARPARFALTPHRGDESDISQISSDESWSFSPISQPRCTSLLWNHTTHPSVTDIIPGGVIGDIDPPCVMMSPVTR